MKNSPTRFVCMAQKKDGKSILVCQTQDTDHSASKSSSSSSSSSCDERHGLLPKAELSLPVPPGPYAIDHFQVARDNVQLRSPERWRVDQFDDVNLGVDNIETIIVDDVEYFGRMEDDYPVYLTYPLPLIMDFFVPSTRKNTHKSFDFFDTTSPDYVGELSLAHNIAAQGTHFWRNDGPPGAPGLLEGDIFALTGNTGSFFMSLLAQVPDDNSLANKVLDTPIGSWTGLQGIYLLDDLSVDAYDRLVQLKADLASDLKGNAGAAYLLMSKIAGSYGVPVSNADSNTVSAADRKRAFDLIMSSSNVQKIKAYQQFSKRHPVKTTKQNDIYHPNYSFSNIQIKDGKIPFIILGEPNNLYVSQDIAEHWASWGLATVIYSIAYTGNYNRVPGKTRSPQQILNDGNCFPDIVSNAPYTFKYNNGNYSIQGDSATDIYQGYINTMGYQYETSNSHTGTTSYEFDRDIIATVIDTAKNAVDVNGKKLTDYVRFTSMGVFGRSGGSMALTGAHAIQKEVPGSFLAGIAQDIVLTYPYIEDGGQTGYGDFFGGFNAELAFPGGLNFPVMFMEPETDWYGAQNNTGANRILHRTVVGARKTLQRIIRKTPLDVRSRSVYLEMSQSSHPDETMKGYMNRGKGYASIGLTPYPLPDLPQFPNLQYDPVWGFRDITNLGGNINASTAIAMGVYYRSMLSTWETIRLNALNYLPFKFDVSPWDIPDADDYQWRGRQFALDLGGKFNARIDIDRFGVDLYNYDTEELVSNPVDAVMEVGGAHYYAFEVLSTDTEAIEVELSWDTSVNATQTPDIDLELYAPNGNTVQVSYYMRPELARFDLSSIPADERLGLWAIGVYYFVGDETTYHLRVVEGTYKVIVDRDYDVAVVNGGDNVPTHPELAVTKRGISILNLPTSSTGLISGDLWDDAGVIKRVP